jgi:hypothetical protein
LGCNPIEAIFASTKGRFAENKYSTARCLAFLFGADRSAAAALSRFAAAVLETRVLLDDRGLARRGFRDFEAAGVISIARWVWMWKEL